MNPKQLEAHCLSEIARFESLLELIRTQKDQPSEAVREKLNIVAYNCSLTSEPLAEEEVSDGATVGESS